MYLHPGVIGDQIWTVRRIVRMYEIVYLKFIVEY